MDDYISRQAALDAIDCDITITGRQNAELAASTIGAFVDRVKALPAADVIPVVRCKDCEWAIKSTELPGWYMCKCEEAFDYYAKPDDFCSYGKKREEEE